MDYQTTLDDSGPDLRAHLAGMARNVTRIVELQARLMMADLRGARRAMITAAVCGSAALAVSSAALPVAIAGLGLLAAEMTPLSVAGGLLTAALVALIVAASLGAYGLRQLSRQRAAWESSKRELQTNLVALRHALTSVPGRQPGETD
jgi:hypothetical protein